MDIYRDAKRRGIYPPLFTDPEGDSCFSIYQIRWIKNAVLISSSETFASVTIFSQTNTDGTMASNTKSAFDKNHLFETSDNIAQKR